MASQRFDSISLDLFTCLDDRDDEDCGVFTKQTKTDNRTGEILCLVCGLIVGTEAEDQDSSAGGSDEDETSDEDYTDDGDDNAVKDKEDMDTEWDAAKKKLESEKQALRELAILLINTSSLAAQQFGNIINIDFNQVLSTHKTLVDRNFYGPRMYKKKMMLCSSLIHFITQSKYKLDKEVVQMAGEDINQIRPIILEGMRKLKGTEEGPIQSWMKIHGQSANIPTSVVEHAVDYFREAEPKMVVADDELKALAWLVLTCRTVGHPLTMKRLQTISGRSRQSIGRVVKAYSIYFEDSND
jgi:hypothetical protein